MKITLLSILRLFSCSNARFVYHLVGLAKSQVTPPSRTRFLLPIFFSYRPPVFLGIGVKAFLFDFEHAECLSVVLWLYDSTYLLRHCRFCPSVCLSVQIGRADRMRAVFFIVRSPMLVASINLCRPKMT